MIDYQQPMFRPPSEANSLLIQATIGCSHNSCTYCAMYRQSNQKFRMRKKDEIFKIIDERSSTDFKRSFIADGNALVMPTQLLSETILQIFNKNKNMERVSLYGNVGDILRKSDDDLIKLQKSGLSLVYIGFESGDNITLSRIKKGATKEETIEAMNKLKRGEII